MNEKSESEYTQLVVAATHARARAVAPYSDFLVGAALLCEDERVYEGCNIESVSYGLSVCAERVAIWKALSDGRRNFKALAVVTDMQLPLTPPCGACRQIIWEYCGRIPVILANLAGETQVTSMTALFPQPFDRSFLAQGKDSTS